MAIEEITMYNTNGEEISISNLVNQMINYYNLKLEVGETRVTDFREGSEIRNLLEAFAVGIYALLEEQHEATRVAFISTSYGEYLDRLGELPFINLPRITGNYAEGTVIFTLSEAQSSDYTISADTLLACSETGLEFVTTTDCLIVVGETSGEASVECLSMGSDGNVASNTIDTVSSEFVDINLVSVRNPSKLENGTDYEDDEEYRERLLANVQADGFGTIGYYQNLCESVKGVHDVLLIDDANYTKKVLVNADNKPTTNAILLEVLSNLTDASKKVLNHTFTVDVPSYTTVNLNISPNVVNTMSTTDLQTIIQAVFDGGSVFQMDFDGLNINSTLSRQDIISALETAFADIVEVTSITSNNTEIETLTPSSNGVLQLGTVEFTQTEV